MRGEQSLRVRRKKSRIFLGKFGKMEKFDRGQARARASFTSAAAIGKSSPRAKSPKAVVRRGFRIHTALLKALTIALAPRAGFAWLNLKTIESSITHSNLQRARYMKACQQYPTPHKPSARSASCSPPSACRRSARASRAPRCRWPRSCCSRDTVTTGLAERARRAPRRAGCVVGGRLD